MKFAENCYRIFWETTQLYHKTDDVDAVVANPYEEGTIEHTLHAKTGLMPFNGTSKI